MSTTHAKQELGFHYFQGRRRVGHHKDAVEDLLILQGNNIPGHMVLCHFLLLTTMIDHNDQVDAPTDGLLGNSFQVDMDTAMF